MKKLVLILTLTSVALGAVVLHLVAELRSERAAALQLPARVGELEGAQERAPKSTPFTTIGPLGTPSNPAEAPAADAKTASARPATLARAATIDISKEERVAMMRRSMERQRELLRDPQYREAMQLQHKASLPSMYPDLATELDLSAAELDGLMSLLADQQIREMERDRTFFETTPDPATMQQLTREQEEHQRAMDNEVRDFLGEEKWRGWSEYKATMGVRHEVAQMRNALAMKGAPLEQHQVKPLQRALADAQRRQMQEWSRAAANSPALHAEPTYMDSVNLQKETLRRQRESQERLLDSLDSVLTAAQLRHVREQQEAQLRLQEAHLRMMQVQAEAEASGRIPPEADVAVGEAMMVTSDALFVQPSP